MLVYQRVLLRNTLYPRVWVGDIPTFRKPPKTVRGREVSGLMRGQLPTIPTWLAASIGGTDSIYVWPIFQAYVRGYPHKIWPYMVLTYLHFRILKFPLTKIGIFWIITPRVGNMMKYDPHFDKSPKLFQLPGWFMIIITVKFRSCCTVVFWDAGILLKILEMLHPSQQPFADSRSWLVVWNNFGFSIYWE